ncbi:hypothetical protein D3C77_158270 [compost metagenome]
MRVTLNESNAHCHTGHRTIASSGPVGQNTLPGSMQVAAEPRKNALQTQVAMVDVPLFERAQATHPPQAVAAHLASRAIRWTQPNPN